jgi:RNA polymerase sigma factor (sigma-70 family)
VTVTIPELGSDGVVGVRPGDQAAATAVDGWLQEYATSRNPQLRERIILAYLGLADRLAGRYRHSRGTTPEDLPDRPSRADHRGRPLQPRPRQPIRPLRRGLCGRGDQTLPARHQLAGARTRPLKEQALQLCKAADELHQTLARAPTITELAIHLDATEEAVLEALAAASSRLGISLDQPAGDHTDACLGDRVAAPGAREELEDLLTLPGLVAGLSELERQVIVMRFFQDLDQDTIAAKVGYPQMHISRLQRRALARMRAQLVEP